MRAVFPIVMGVVCATSGCTSLVSKKLGEKPENAATGLMYRLPKKQFDLTVTYELVGCNVVANKVELDAKVTGVMTESVVGDDEQTYYLDYSELSALTKISTVDIGVTDTGLLTSINSTMTDQTGPIIANVGTAAFSVARGIALTSFPGAAALDGVVTATLKNLDTTMIRARVRANEEVPKIESASDLCSVFNKAKKEYDDAAKAAKAAAALAKEHGEDVEVLASRKALDAQLRTEQSFYKEYGTAAQYNAAAAALDASTKALAVAQTKADSLNSADAGLEKANKALVEAKSKMFLDYAIQFTPSLKSQEISVDLMYSRIDSLFDTTVKPCTQAVQTNCVQLPAVTLSAKPVAGYVPQNPGFKDGKAGVVYRLPATAEMEAKTMGSVVFLKQRSQIPQYGHIASLDLSNGVFADNLLKVTFGTNGVPTQLSFSSQSQAEAASKAASQTAQSYFEFAKNRQQDRVDATKTQIGLEKDRASAGAAVAADNLETLRTIQKLQALANGTSSEASNQLVALTNQRELLEAQLKLLELQKQINDAKAALGTSPGQ